jgi:hypothetical protein
MTFRGVLLAVHHAGRNREDVIPDQGAAREILGSADQWRRFVGGIPKGTNQRDEGAGPRRQGDTLYVSLYEFLCAPDLYLRTAWQPVGFRFRKVGQSKLALPYAVSSWFRTLNSSTS